MPADRASLERPPHLAILTYLDDPSAEIAPHLDPKYSNFATYEGDEYTNFSITFYLSYRFVNDLLTLGRIFAETFPLTRLHIDQSHQSGPYGYRVLHFVHLTYASACGDHYEAWIKLLGLLKTEGLCVEITFGER